MTAQELIDLLRVLIGGPAVTLWVAVLVLVLFKDNVARLIDRIKTVTFPGGQIDAQARVDETPAPETKPPVPNDEKPAVPASPGLAPDVQKKVVELLTAERQNALLWEFKYLNHFLQPFTQQILEWIAGQPNETTSLTLLENAWAMTLPTREQKAIIDALEGHGLITVDTVHVQLTDKGRTYRTWRAPVLANLVAPRAIKAS